MRRWVLAAVVAFGALLGIVACGDDEESGEAGIWTVHTDVDGLSLGRCGGLSAADNGWVYTVGSNGIFRLSEGEWTQMPDPAGFDPCEFVMDAAPNGELWIMDEQGTFVLVDGSWVQYPAPTIEEFQINPAAGDFFPSDLEIRGDGTVFVVMNEMLAETDGPTIVPLDAEFGPAADATQAVMTRSIAIDSNDAVWLFGDTEQSGGGLFVLADGQVRLEPVDGGVILGVGPDGTIFEDSARIVDGVGSPYPFDDGVDAAFDAEGTAWIAVPEMRWDPFAPEMIPTIGPAGAWAFDGDDWQRFTTDDGLPSNDLIAVEAAPDGTIWFGTRSNGLVSYRPT